MVMTAVERRHATLVSADATGYSRLMAVDELATIEAIKVFREAGEQIAVEHGGRLVDSPGDNLLFEFGGAAAALDASLRFQEFVLNTNEQYEPANRMQFRMGMHSGEVIVEGDRDLRLRHQHRCSPRAARTPRRHLHLRRSFATRSEIRRRSRTSASQYVKNIPHPVHAFFVDVPGQTVPERPTTLVLARDRRHAVRDRARRRRRRVPRRRHSPTT